MKAAVIQMNSGADKEKNVRQAYQLAEKACCVGAKLVVLPEVFVYRGPLDGKQKKKLIVERLRGPLVRGFSDLAKTKKAWLVLGSVYEQSQRPGKLYNTSLVVSPEGKIAAVYRKKHLFNARLTKKSVSEDRHFIEGKSTVSVELDRFRMGCAICYDLRFPRMFQQYYEQGCSILAIPSSFTAETGKAHWEILLRARAIETRSYVLAPNQWGCDGNGVESYGNSMIVGPWGEVLARAGAKKTTILYADLFYEEINKARKKLP